MSLDAAQLFSQTGCLLLARVDGKARPTTSRDDERAAPATSPAGCSTDPPATVTDAWELLA